MITQLKTIHERLNTSLWFVPAIMVLTAMGAAVGMVMLDSTIPDGALDRYWWAFGGGAEGARGVLSAIAGSMVGVASVTFSVTIVALTLASQQFTPRVLREFMSDRGNQIVIGGFIATFIYSLLVLRNVHGGQNEFVPQLAVTGAMGLALASVGLLIYFIHHAAESIQVSYIVAHVADETHRLIDHLFPQPIGQGASDEEIPVATIAEIPGERHYIRSRHSGYLQMIETETLMECARDGNLIIKMERAVGEFVPWGHPVLSVWPGTCCTEEIKKRLERSFATGRDRTMQEDPEFGVVQIVDIAVKALSPGINDPTTAIICLDHLSAILRHMGGRSLPSRLRQDEAGEIRVIARGPDFRRMADVAFNQIRQHAGTHVAVLIRMVHAIAEVAEVLPNEDRRQVLRRHLKLIEAAAARHLDEPSDLDDLRWHVERARALLNGETETALPRAA